MRNVIANATNLSNQASGCDGRRNGVLRGTAADPHERTLAAAIISMSPGVYNIREIKVVAAAANTQGPAPMPATGQGPSRP